MLRDQTRRALTAMALSGGVSIGGAEATAQDASGRGEEPSAGGGGGVARFFAEMDVQGRFGFSSSAGREPTFGFTTRFRRPYLFSALGDRNQVAFGPMVSVRANSADQDDENSVLLAAPLTITRSRGARRVPLAGLEESPEAPLVNAFVVTAGPELEVNKGFSRGNFAPDAELGFGLPTFGGENQAVEAWPYVGVEVGMGLGGGEANTSGGSSGMDAAESVARVKAGVDARYRLSFAGDRLHEIVFDLEFVYRRLYAVEPLGTWIATERRLAGENGPPAGGRDEEAIVIVRTLQRSVGKGPRRYLNAAVRFAFTENWELVVSYARGALPPLFVEVDKVEAGFGIRLGDRF